MRPPPANPLSDKAVTVARIGGVGSALQSSAAIALVMSFAIVLPDISMTAIGGAIGVSLFVFFLVTFVFIRPPLYARYWRYEILDHELYVQHGFVTISRVLIPLRRIQNVDTSQGPVARRFGVSSVTVSTAGGAQTIPMLDDEVAETLRQRLDERAKAARADAETEVDDAR